MAECLTLLSPFRFQPACAQTMSARRTKEPPSSLHRTLLSFFIADCIQVTTGMVSALTKDDLPAPWTWLPASGRQRTTCSHLCSMMLPESGSLALHLQTKSYPARLPMLALSWCEDKEPCLSSSFVPLFNIFSFAFQCGHHPPPSRPTIKETCRRRHFLNSLL